MTWLDFDNLFRYFSSALYINGIFFWYLGIKKRKINDDVKGYDSDDDYDNKSLIKVWNAFKSATLTDQYLKLSEEEFLIF